jgi:hypothetical protein
MSDPKQTPKPAYAGLRIAQDLAAFEPDASTPPMPDPKLLAQVSERAGFPSREPKAPTTPKPAPASRELTYDARLTIRVREEDKARFDDLVYKNRLTNGAFFQKLLDHFEGAEE